MDDAVIALFEFSQDENGVGIFSEKHYKLVSPEDLTEADLRSYGQHTND